MIEKNTTEDNVNSYIKEIKKDFFRYRNGIIVDSIKQLYPPGKKIFGLIVPQFVEIAKKYPKDLSLGLKLWEDKNNRESRLLSLYILPPRQISKEKALEMIFDVESSEEAEFLAFRILRNLPYALELMSELRSLNLPNDTAEFCLLMFERNMAIQNIDLSAQDISHS